MPNREVNMTQLCASKEIQSVLLELQEDRENILLRDPDYQRQIIKYVLSNLSHRYIILSNITEISRTASDIFPQCLIQERKAIH